MKRQGHDKIGTAEMLSLLARLQYRLGDLAAEEKLSREQLALADGIGSPGLTATALRDLGRCRLAAGDLAGARRHLAAAVRSHSDHGEALAAAAARLELAGSARLAGEPAEASRLAAQVADWYGERGMSGYRARALALLSQALLDEGRIAEAWRTAGQAHAISEPSEDLDLQLAVVTAMAPAGVAAGEGAASLGHLSWAIAEAARIGDVAAGLEARLILGALQLKTGDAIAGRATLEAVRRDAQARGFQGVARRAAALLVGQAVPLG
jgi:tetratricopeptide (TPR) repeat protein